MLTILKVFLDTDAGALLMFTLLMSLAVSVEQRKLLPRGGTFQYTHTERSKLWGWIGIRRTNNEHASGSEQEDEG